MSFFAQRWGVSRGLSDNLPSQNIDMTATEAAKDFYDHIGLSDKNFSADDRAKANELNKKFDEFKIPRYAVCSPRGGISYRAIGESCNDKKNISYTSEKVLSRYLDNNYGVGIDTFKNNTITELRSKIKPKEKKEPKAKSEPKEKKEPKAKSEPKAKKEDKPEPKKEPEPKEEENEVLFDAGDKVYLTADTGNYKAGQEAIVRHQYTQSDQDNNEKISIRISRLGGYVEHVIDTRPWGLSHNKPKFTKGQSVVWLDNGREYRVIGVEYDGKDKKYVYGISPDRANGSGQVAVDEDELEKV